MPRREREQVHCTGLFSMGKCPRRSDTNLWGRQGPVFNRKVERWVDSGEEKLWGKGMGDGEGRLGRLPCLRAVA